jgi:hypothetical protein
MLQKIAQGFCLIPFGQMAMEASADMRASAAKLIVAASLDWAFLKKRKKILETFHINHITNPVYGRRVNSFVLVCSLSSHRHFFIRLIFGSRFIDS